MLLLLRRRGNRFVYLLRATFSQNMAAPLPASLPIDVGGPLTLVQSDGQFSQSGGKMVVPAQTTPVWGDLSFRTTDSVARVPGRALLCDLRFTTVNYFILAFDNNTTLGDVGAGVTGFRTEVNVLAAIIDGAQASLGVTPAIGTDYTLVCILRSAGAFFLIKGGAYTQWTLLWVGNVGTSTPLYPSFNNYSAVLTLDNLRVTDLATFATDAMVYTSRLVSPAAGATTTSTADAHIETNFVWSNAANMRVQFRRTDASNNWMVAADAGGSLTLWERAAGVTTDRVTVAPGFVNGQAYRMVIIASATVVKVYLDNVLRITYSSASSNQSATTVYVEGIGGNITTLICWPLYPAIPGDI